MGGVIRLNQTLKMYREGQELQGFYMGGREVWKKPLRSMYPSRLVDGQDEVLFVGSSDIGCLLAATWSPTTHGWFTLFRDDYMGGLSRPFEGRTMPGVGAAVTYGRISTPTMMENARNGVYDAAVNPYQSLGNYDTLVIDTSDIELGGLPEGTFPNTSDYYRYSRMASPYSFYDYAQLHWMNHEFETRMELLRMCSEMGVRKLFLMTPWPRLYPTESGLQTPAGDRQWYDRFFQNLEDSMHYQQDRVNAQIEFEGLTTHVTLVPMHLMIKRICDAIFDGTAPAALTSVRKLFAHLNNLSQIDPLDDTQPKHWYMLNYYGTYAINCLWAAIAYKKDPRGYPRTDGHYTVDEESATFFQNLAWDIAQTYGRAGQTRSNPGYTMHKLRNRTPAETLGSRLLLHAENMTQNTPISLARTTTAKHMLGVVEVDTSQFPTTGFTRVIQLPGASAAGPLLEIWNDNGVLNFTGGYSDGGYSGELAIATGLNQVGNVNQIYFDLILPHADNPQIHGQDIMLLVSNLNHDHMINTESRHRRTGAIALDRAMSPISNRAVAPLPTSQARVLDLIVSEEFIPDGDRAEIMRYFTRKHRTNGIYETFTPDLSPFVRRETQIGNTQIHSGHSLVDAYINVGAPFPGYYRNIMESLGHTGTWEGMPKSTIPGSPMHIRWNNPPNDSLGDPVIHPDWFDTLVLTDVNNALDVNNPDTGTLDYLCRFVANQVVNGRGNEVILWSIWGDLNGGYLAPFQNQTFRQYLETLGAGYKFMADYATWKMHQLYPDLIPADWRVWVFPGHRWMMRVYDDVQAGLVPGITQMSDLFRDTVHPNDDVGGYGLAAFVATCMKQVHLGQAGAYVPDTSVVSADLVAYFHQVAWEIASEYEPTGMGGSVDAELLWDGSEADLLPNWEFSNPAFVPSTPGGGDPDPEDPTDPVPTGATLLWEATDLTFDGVNPQQFVMPTALQGGQPVYVIIRTTLGEEPGNESILFNLSTQAELWQKAMVIMHRSDLDAINLDNDPGGSHASAWPAPAVGVPTTIEAWIDGTGATLDGFGNGPQRSTVKRPATHTCPRVTIGQHEWGVAPVNAVYHGIRVYQGIPTAAERADIQAWAAGLA